MIRGVGSWGNGAGAQNHGETRGSGDWNLHVMIRSSKDRIAFLIEPARIGNGDMGYYLEVEVPGIAIGALSSSNLLRVAARIAGPVGVALLAIDMAMITIDTVRCYEEKTASQGTSVPSGQ